MHKNPIVIEAMIYAPISKVWAYYNQPEHIVHWAFALDEWEAPSAESDLRVGGRFKTRMSAKDKSAGFDFTGTFTKVVEPTLRAYEVDDGRQVTEEFVEVPEGVKITISFDPESVNPAERQREGWQAILNNFKNYVEQN